MYRVFALQDPDDKCRKGGKLIYMYREIARLVYWRSGEQFLN